MNLDSVRDICRNCDVSHCVCLRFVGCTFGRDRCNVQGALLGVQSNLPSVFGLFWRDFINAKLLTFLACL